MEGEREGRKRRWEGSRSIKLDKTQKKISKRAVRLISVQNISIEL